MNKLTGGLAALAVLMATPGFAQTIAAEAMPLETPPAPLVVAPAAAPVLRSGTPVSVRLLQELTTERKRARVGDRFRLETVDPVIVDGVTVIPAGSPAMGEITEVRNKGMWGKSGHLAARLLYVAVNGRQIRLGGEFDDKGRAGGAGAVAVSALVFLPAGFFMTGTSARIPPGTVIASFIDEDVPLALPSVAPQPQPLAVGAPAQPALRPAPQVSLAGATAADSAAQARCWRDRTC